MSERIEKLIRDYPKNKMELECLKHQICNFRGVTETDVIDSMFFSQPEGERVQTSGTSDKTARIAINYRQRMERINNEWYEHLEKQYMELSEEIRFFESEVSSLQGVPGKVMADLVLREMTWEKVAEKYYISRRTVGNYRAKAMVELENLYESRDAELVAYMLS